MDTKAEHGAPSARVAKPPAWITSERAPTDEELIDFLQALTDEAQYTGRVVLRDSEIGRGWRLHETRKGGAVPDVRQAIIRYAVDRFPGDESSNG